MKAGYYRYEHKYMSRNGNKTRGGAPSAYGHLAKASNYYANENKCETIRHVNLSSDRRVLWHLLNAHDKTITRKNGRIAETPQFCFDNRMSMAHIIEATDRFNWRVSFGGRIKVATFIHTNDPNNLHAHCIIIDTDKHGNPVGYFSANAGVRRQKSEVTGNLVEWFRRMWEEECNTVLAEHDYDFRIDRCTNLERGLEPPGQHRGYDYVEPLPELADNDNNQEPANDNPEPIDELLPPHAPSTEVEEEEQEPIALDDEPEPEEDMAVPVPQRLQYARRELKELSILRQRRAEVARIRKDYDYWRGEAVIAREKAGIAFEAMTAAKSRTDYATSDYKATHLFGIRKGLDLNLGFMRIRTKGIEKAIKAEAEYQNAAYAEALRGHDFREAEEYANRATRMVWEIEQKVRGAENALDVHERINGQEHDLQAAEEMFEELVGEHLEGLSPNDVMDAYDDDLLTLDECKEILEVMGHPELVNWIEAQEEETPSIRH